MIKHSELQYGKIYRWRCSRELNTIKYCICDEEDAEWKQMTALRRIDGQHPQEEDDIHCGDTLVVLKEHSNNDLVVLTMTNNPVIGIMIGTYPHQKLYMIEES